MKRTFICVVCPNGCEIEVEHEGTKIINVQGNRCEKGRAYVSRELITPMRTITTTVPVLHGDRPLVSVRLTAPIPRDRIFDAMREINRLRLTAPVFMGDVILSNLLGLGTDVITTGNVENHKD